MAGHKKQHFVPSSYLKAWCDPATPAEQEPYVWVFPKDGSAPRRKSPDNIFHETDMYTIHLPDGGRDLILEHGLSQLEGDFVRIRERCLETQRMPSSEDKLKLCAFAAAMHARTPARRDHLANEWGKALSMMDDMRAWAETATEEQKRAASSLGPSDPDRSLSYEDVKVMATQPIQTSLVVHVSTEAPLLFALDMAIVNALGKSRFITSDTPCVWFDSAAYKRPPLYRSPALMYDTIEITLPISPTQLLLLNRLGRTGHCTAPDSTIDDFNRRTRFYCRDSFINFENATHPRWFDAGTEPDDSWDKQHRRPEQ